MPVLETDMVVLDQASKEYVNMGIGIVVPAKKILETINQPEIEKIRMEVEAQRREQSLATLD